MKRKPVPWTAKELVLLGLYSDGEVAKRSGRQWGTVWQKRRDLGIAQTHLQFRKWTRREDRLVEGAENLGAVAKRLGRTVMAVKSRRAVLERGNRSKEKVSAATPCRAVLKE